METTDLLKKVRQIEIKTNGLSNHIFAGEYHSAFKGRGMTFSEVREYQYGDDVRNIDWNVTARFNKPYVKIFEEEREMTVMLVVDVSRSGEFGTRKMTKKQLITEIAATLAFSTIQNNDKVGVVMFSDKIEKYIPPQKGRKHILYIIRELLNYEPESRKTDIGLALEYLSNVQKKRSTSFLISDLFEVEDFSEELSIAVKKHDLIVLRIHDPMEFELPDVGLMKLNDAESGEEMWVDTSDKKLQMDYKNYVSKKVYKLDQLFNKNGVDTIQISTSEDYVKSLIRLFKLRS